MAARLDLLQLARQRNWRAEDPTALAIVAKHLLEGNPVHIVQEAGPRDWHAGLPESARVLDELPIDPDPSVALLVISDRSGRPRPDVDRLAVLRPQTLTLGVACRRGAALEDLEEALREFGRREKFSPLSLAAVAASSRRERHGPLEEFAERRRLPLLLYPDPVLSKTPLPPPGKMAGTCEVSAILAAGVTAPLVRSVAFYGKLTMALARRAQNI